MNTSQLECFVQVAQSLSFRRAAEELHLSQPTVSKQIASLEAELGGVLFVRTTREVMLTSLGESFLRDAREILHLAYAAGERARRYAEGTNLSVAYSDSCELMRLIPVLDALRRETRVHVALSQGPRDSNITQLEREQVDVVLGYEPATLPAGVDFHPLRTDSLACVVRIDSPLADLVQVTSEDVDGLPYILVQPAGLRRKGYRAQSSLPAADESKTTVCCTASEAYCLVDAGFGFALVPGLYTMPDPFHKVLPWNPSASVDYGLFCRRTRGADLVARFLELAQDAYGRHDYARPTPEVWRPRQ